MFIDLSGQQEGDGRGFQPVAAPSDIEPCGWGKYWSRRSRFQRLRRALRYLLKRL